MSLLRSAGAGPPCGSPATLYSLYTQFTHIVHKFYTHCIHTVHTLYTHCTHILYKLWTHCTHIVHTVYTQCTHTVHTFYIHFTLAVHTLHKQCTQTVHTVLPVVAGQLTAGVVHHQLLLQVDVAPVEGLVLLELVHSVTQLDVPRAPGVPGGSAAHPPGLTVGSHQSEKENINGSIQGGESRLVAS